jgi:hypothetical protein
VRFAERRAISGAECSIGITNQNANNRKETKESQMGVFNETNLKEYAGQKTDPTTEPSGETVAPALSVVSDFGAEIPPVSPAVAVGEETEAKDAT